MRMTMGGLGLACALAGCGGAREPAEQPGQADTAQGPPVGGTAHNVNMVFQGGSDYRFVPADLTIRAGDRIVFHNVSGPPHNVSFWADSIPAGAQAVLEPQFPNPIGPLQGELLTEIGATLTLNFAGAPAGLYRFYCTPHLAMGMRGTITVTQ